MKNFSVDLVCSFRNDQVEAVNHFKSLAADKVLLELLSHRLVRNQYAIRVSVTGHYLDLMAWLDLANDLYPHLEQHVFPLKDKLFRTYSDKNNKNHLIH